VLFAEIKDKLDYLRNIDDCTKLSGGEKQIILFLRAINSMKENIFLDESFSSIDKKYQEKMIKILFLKFKTVIFISHINENKFQEKFDKIYHLKDGKLIS